MLKLKRHHHILLVALVIFVAAWFIWTMVLLPRSEAPSLPVPTGATVPAPATK